MEEINCFSVGGMEERIADRVRMLMKEIVMIKARSAKIKLHKIQMRRRMCMEQKSII